MATSCNGCGRISLAVLRNGGIAGIEEIAAMTGYSVSRARAHIEHLMDSGQMTVAGGGRWRLIGVVTSEKPT